MDHAEISIAFVQESKIQSVSKEMILEKYSVLHCINWHAKCASNLKLMI
jgi:hypothetical protein